MTLRSHPAGLSRRRFLTISAAAAGIAVRPALALAEPSLQRWRGIALGAGAEIRLRHPDAEQAQRIFTRLETEIGRLENIFSLYRQNSALARLNRDGRIAAPPLELVEVLASARRIHATTGGAFDPSIQPLWQLYAQSFADRAAPDGATGRPDPAALHHALSAVGFDKVDIEPPLIAYQKPGMALTLNGIAQGYVTDRIATLLRQDGFTNVLVNLGEIAAYGDGPDATGGWDVLLSPGQSENGRRLTLKDRAVATSSLTGTTFDQTARISHILDPRTGLPARSGLAGVSIVAPTAALADGLSTAALVCGEQVLIAALEAFPRCEGFILRNDGSSGALQS